MDWQAIPADALSHEGSFTLEGKVLGYDLTAQLTVRVSEKTGEILSVNRDYNAEDTRHLLVKQTISIQIKSTISITSMMVATMSTTVGPTGRESRIKQKCLLVSSSRKMVE